MEIVLCKIVKRERGVEGGGGCMLLPRVYFFFYSLFEFVDTIAMRCSLGS